ncbi:MAG: hypothetical protein A3E83_03185 [Gammaproteobacteria bacterium RIFCSPHIGHO2_12_FULL_41_20]|nr:MAG: hypothetical protein A3E83_03185 [Gammaproteobacteria bacterium RIFCSPHIGHO2_12_FULL_41_20]
MGKDECRPYTETISIIVDGLTLEKIHFIIKLSDTEIIAAQNLNVNAPFLTQYLAEQGTSFDLLKRLSYQLASVIYPNYEKIIALPPESAPGLTLRTIHHHIRYADDLPEVAQRLNIGITLLASYLTRQNTNFIALKYFPSSDNAAKVFPHYDTPVSLLPPHSPTMPLQPPPGPVRRLRPFFFRTPSPSPPSSLENSPKQQNKRTLGA